MGEKSPGVSNMTVEEPVLKSILKNGSENGRKRSKSPPVPIKTYLWEELRRSKSRGAYPWTHLLKPPFNEEEWIKFYQEHEYEPINPMPVMVQNLDVEPAAGGTPRTPEKKRDGKRFIRIPNTDQVIIPLHGSSDEEINPDRYVEQDMITTEEIGVAGGSSAATTRTGSRTEEVNTSQVESSALERLPLQKSSRDPQTHSPEAQGKIGKRLRTQAGKITTKLRNIPRPKINLPERPKIKLPEKPKFLKEKPKFLTEKPKFLTEKPKFLTEKPKFLTEKPKFLTEKPKFLKERPKFQAPKMSMPKFEFMKKQPAKKGTSSTRRPLREKSESSRSEAAASTKKNLFDSFKYPTYPRFFKKKKERGKITGTPPLGMGTESSLQSSPGSKRNFKWVETYRDIKFDDEAPQPPRRKTVEEKENYDKGNEEEEEEMEEELEEEEPVTGEDPAHFQDSYFPEVVHLERRGPGEEFIKAKAESTSSVGGDSEKEQQSSGSSSARRRAGVLEEIDSDEFFLREKGLSREDVDVSRFLSLEIRDAFRSSKNALARIDAGLYYDDYEDEPPPIMKEPPKVPQRKKGLLKKRSKSGDRGSSAVARDSGFHTFPMRPSRRKQSEPASLGSSREPIEKPPRRRNRSKSGSSLGLGGRSSLPGLNVFSDSDIPPSRTPPQPPNRKRSSSKDLAKREENIDWIDDGENYKIVRDEEMAQDLEVQRCFEAHPVAPVRRTRSRGTSLAEDDRTSRGVESIPSEIPQDEELQMEEDEIHHIRHHTSVKGEEEEDMGVDLIEEEKREEKGEEGIRKVTSSPDVDIAGYAVVSKESKVLASPPPRPPPPPSRNRRKPPATHLKTIKNHGLNFFFTYPRRAIRSFQMQQKSPPVRPIRNYSTLGPSRPPRKSRVFREPVYAYEVRDSNQVAQEIGDDMKIEDYQEKILELLAKEDEEGRDLQSGVVVEKMKGRPLPPPPRPPRKSKEDETLNRIAKEETEVVDGESADEEKLAVAVNIAQIESEILPPELLELSRKEALRAKRDDFFSTFAQIKPPELDIEALEKEAQDKRVDVQQQTSFDFDREPSGRVDTATVMEVTVSVQTDPLPDDFLVEETETISLRSETIFPEEVPPLPPLPPRAPLTPEKTSLSQQEIEEHVRTPTTFSLTAESPTRSQRDITPSIEGPSSRPEPSQIIVQQVIPEKVHLSELEVDKLNVNEIQAKKIVVSDIDGQTMQLTELSSKGGNLVLSNVEMPKEMIQTIANQIQTKLAEMAPPPPPQPQLMRVVTPPPPIIVSPSATEVTQPTLQTSSAVVGAAPDYIPKPKTTKSKGRKSPTRVIDDSEDELATLMPQRRPKREEETKDKDGGGEEVLIKKEEEGDKSPLPVVYSKETRRDSKDEARHQMTSAELLSQLFTIWRVSLIEAADRFVVGVNSVFPEGEKRKDAQTAACILLVLIAGLIMLGFGSDNTVHHHHWDYVPPR